MDWKRVLVATIWLIPATAALAQEPVKLQCKGTYSNFSEKIMDAPVNGMYVEIHKEHIKVLSTPGFNGSYQITNRLENGIGFQHEADAAYSGFLNRFSGQISLSQKQTSNRYAQLLSADCARAKPPLF